ncbi:MAG: class I SAM-dependent methyltransferase [Promethearchaeota archaeon]|jgi:methyltransferase (TIGR00027 family)
MDYPTIRSSFIEENLLTPWCNTHSQSQIVLLGAGLDTRAYRFKPLQVNQHSVFEIDFPIVIDYKEKILKKEKPLCNIIRLSADLVDPEWSSQLVKNGFSMEIPTFWIMEGLVYYLKRDEFSTLITKTAEISKEGSQIFIDILHVSRREPSSYFQGTDLTNPFSTHQKWGLNIEEVPKFFETTGWKVKSYFVDEYDQGRNVGQKGMVFIKGLKD